MRPPLRPKGWASIPGDSRASLGRQRSRPKGSCEPPLAPSPPLFRPFRGHPGKREEARGRWRRRSEGSSSHDSRQRPRVCAKSPRSTSGRFRGVDVSEIPERLRPLHDACEALRKWASRQTKQLDAPGVALSCAQARVIRHDIRGNDFDLSKVSEMRGSLTLVGDPQYESLVRVVDDELAELLGTKGPWPTRFDREIDL